MLIVDVQLTSHHAISSVECTTVILINGTSRQTFLFPADVATASTFYRDFGRILPYLPHIQLVKAYRPDQFRVMYHTLELNVYRVRITAICKCATTKPPRPCT